MSQLSLLAEMQDSNQDYEWYPTTNEIIAAFSAHAMSENKSVSILDVGAGDGKVLKAFADFARQKENRMHVELFAIEKSIPLLGTLDSDIGIVGTDFWEQTLVDKKIDVIFSNPPYSEFVQWSEKVIREANAGKVYLVIPQRWTESVLIQGALTARKASAKVIGSFDFLNAEDRQARAKVDLVFIDLRLGQDRYGYRSNVELTVDPFELWASDYYNLKRGDISENDISDYQKDAKEKAEFCNELNKKLVVGKNMIEAMTEMYMFDMGKLVKTYKDVSDMDPDLMRELNVSVKSLLSSLKLRIKGLKNLYWSQLFEKYEPIVSRLTAKSRANLTSTLREKTDIDFTANNAYAVTIWAIKNANGYFDAQLIKVFESMLELANVVNYKSNQRVFLQQDYRYGRRDFLENATFVKLEYRIVCEFLGGIGHDRYESERNNGLHSNAYEFLNDVLTVANNLGFIRNDSMNNHYFKSGAKEVFTYNDVKSGSSKTLMEVKAFKNGNLHIKFSSDFMLALNVEVGRLKGWIHTAQQAAEEMNEDLEKVSAVFKSSFQLLPSTASEIFLLGGKV
jgi:hypothetical protein